MLLFFNPGKKAVVRPLIKLSKLDREFKTIKPSVTYLSSPSQLKRLPTFYILSGSEYITYLPKCLPQTPFNRICGINLCDEILQNTEHNKGTAMVCLNILKTVMECYFGLKDTAIQ